MRFSENWKKITLIKELTNQDSIIIKKGHKLTKPLTQTLKPENKMGKNLVTAEPRHAHIDQERRMGERESRGVGWKGLDLFSLAGFKTEDCEV